MVSYGSGAGADGFVLKVGKGIIQKRKVVPQVDDFIKDKKYISYVQYLRFGGKI
jgi:hydroxymethylglutaryl-CoA synthase